MNKHMSVQEAEIYLVKEYSLSRDQPSRKIDKAVIRANYTSFGYALENIEAGIENSPEAESFDEFCVRNGLDYDHFTDNL